MIPKIIDLAEKIGNSLANKSLPQIDLPKVNFTFFPTTKDFLKYQIRPFKENENGSAFWYGFISNFSNIKEEIVFYTSGHNKDIKLFVLIPHKLKNYFENTFYASFPTSELIFLGDVKFKNNYSYINFKDAEFHSDIDFSKNGVYLDPFKDLLSVYYSIEDKNNLEIYFNFLFSPKKNIFAKLMDFIAGLYKHEDKSKDSKEKSVDNSSKKKDLKFSIGYLLTCEDQIVNESINKNLLNAFDKFIKSGKIKISSLRKSYLGTFNQVINFFHLPTKEYPIKNLDYLTYRRLPYPPTIPTVENSEKNEVTLLGYVDHKNETNKFGIRKEDKFRHLYVIGKTGTGKSTLISNMVRSDMITNNGLCIIDPHGDLINTVLQHVPSWRTNDVILFDVSDTSHPIGLNFLQYENPEQKNLIVSGIVSTFNKLYGQSWGPRLEYILRNVLLSVIEYPNATFLHINRMLTDKNFEKDVLEYVTDPIILKFWRDEFDKRTDKFKDEAIAPIVNKVGQFLSSSLVRNIFGQPKSKLNFRQVMDEGKILLVNLSKGKIGEDNANMIGSFMVTKFQIDAMSRADIATEAERRDFYLYIDEFQNFATESFESILSEARKYKLSLIVANQYISQLDDKIKNAIFGNVGTIISFGLGYDDAALMSSQFKGMVSANDLLSLPKFKAYVKLMVDGITSDPFSMRTFPLPKAEQGEEIMDKLKKQTRQRYAMEKEKLENLLKVWAEKSFSPVEKVMEKAKAEAKKEQIKKGELKTQNLELVSRMSSGAEGNEVKDLQNSYSYENGNLDSQSITTEAGQTLEGQETIEIDNSESQEFSVKDIKIGEWYDGYVKLKYNYGLFITVKGVEGLLHKKLLNCPEGIRWKDLYNIGDKIKVKAEEIKEMEGEKRVVWTQL